MHNSFLRVHNRDLKGSDGVRKIGMVESKAYRAFALFVTSGSVYVTVELLYRQKSHYSMFIAAGVSVLVIALLCQYCEAVKKRSLFFKAVMGSAIITLNELVSGLIVNVGFGLNVWDYSDLPLDFMGQICVPFSIIWILFSFPAIYVGKVFLSD